MEIKKVVATFFVEELFKQPIYVVEGNIIMIPSKSRFEDKGVEYKNAKLCKGIYVYESKVIDGEICLEVKIDESELKKQLSRWFEIQDAMFPKSNS